MKNICNRLLLQWGVFYKKVILIIFPLIILSELCCADIYLSLFKTGDCVDVTYHPYGLQGRKYTSTSWHYFDASVVKFEIDEILLYLHVVYFNYVCPTISHSSRKLCFPLIKQLSGIFFCEFAVVLESNNGFQGFVNIKKVLCTLLHYQYDQYTCLTLKLNPLFSWNCKCYIHCVSIVYIMCQLYWRFQQKENVMRFSSYL